jgi:hypothetical protein
MEHAIDKDDSVITAYRCHGWTYMRGKSVLEVLAELTGKYSTEFTLSILDSSLRSIRKLFSLVGRGPKLFHFVATPWGIDFL